MLNYCTVHILLCGFHTLVFVQAGFCWIVGSTHPVKMWHGPLPNEQRGVFLLPMKPNETHSSTRLFQHGKSLIKTLVFGAHNASNLFCFFFWLALALKSCRFQCPRHRNRHFHCGCLLCANRLHHSHHHRRQGM